MTTVSDVKLDKLIEELSKIDFDLAKGPWNEGALYSAIRHVQRNTDVMEDSLAYEPKDAPRGTPDRYDGTNLAKLRNLLPAIIAALERLLPVDAGTHVIVPVERHLSAAFEQSRLEGNARDGFGWEIPEGWEADTYKQRDETDFPVTIIRNAKP